MANRPPAFQFYVKDWLSSRTIARLTPAQRGGYIQLLAHCWNDDRCSLPDVDSELAGLSGLRSSWRGNTITALRECFIPHPEVPDCLTHNKLWEQWLRCIEWREKCADGGRKSRPPEPKGSSSIEEPPPNTASAPASAPASAKNLGDGKPSPGGDSNDGPKDKESRDKAKPKPKRDRKVDPETWAKWLVWVRWFAAQYLKITHKQQPGFDPESNAMHPKIQQAARWFCAEIASGRATPKQIGDVLRTALRKEYYIGRPPGNLAEFAKLYPSLLIAATKSPPVNETPGSERMRGSGTTTEFESIGKAIGRATKGGD